MVAVKKIIDPFRMSIDSKRLLREIKILRHFHHDNVLGLVEDALAVVARADDCEREGCEPSANRSTEWHIARRIQSGRTGKS